MVLYILVLNNGKDNIYFVYIKKFTQKLEIFIDTLHKKLYNKFIA